MHRLFASDNASPAHPAILRALAEHDCDHHISYGDDPATRAAEAAISELFGRECGVYFAYNGTGANVTALRAMVRPWEAVICSEMAHIAEDEAGACEAIGGFKLLPVHVADGRLTAESLTPFLARRGFEHTSQPAAVSITQVSEVGTLYEPAPLARLSAAAHDAGLTVHADGARVANAAAAWQERRRAGGESIGAAEALRAVTVDAGVDVLSFGATKNGLLFGEAIVFFNRALEDQVRFIRKQTTQLHSKMRYTAVQFLRYLEDDLWIENARSANRNAQRLSRGLAAIPGCRIAHPTDANGVFAVLPEPAIEVAVRDFGCYRWGADGTVRLMVSWDTSETDIDRCLDAVRGVAGDG